MQEEIKCIGVWTRYDGSKYRLYYNGKFKEYFVLTPNFRVTRAPRRISDELADWCVKEMKRNLERVEK